MRLASMSNVTSIWGTPLAVLLSPRSACCPLQEVCPLQHADFRLPLDRGHGIEGLGESRRDGCIACDGGRGDAAYGLNGEGHGRHVKQHKALGGTLWHKGIAGEGAGLDRRADRDALIRVDAVGGLLSDELPDLLLHGGQA